MMLAAAFLTGTVILVADVIRCPEFTCEVSGVDHFHGGIVCRRFCSPEDQTNLREFLIKTARELQEMYTSQGFLEAEVHLEAYPSEESPALKVKVIEGNIYRVKGIEIRTERPDYETDSLRDQLLIHVNEECKPWLVDVSARRMQVRGEFKSSEYEIIKGPFPGEAYVRITLSDNSEQPPPE